jgi:hypothetical protein
MWLLASIRGCATTGGCVPLLEAFASRSSSVLVNEIMVAGFVCLLENGSLSLLTIEADALTEGS